MNQDPDWEDDIAEFGLSDCPECNGIESMPDCKCKGAGFLLYGCGDVEGVKEAFVRVYAARKSAKPFPPNGWQLDKPTNGRWLVSIHPKDRGNWAAVIEVVVSNDEVYILVGYGGNVPIPLTDQVFKDALWQRREIPEDPFK